ncbi:T9SS type A sorting domain-containing protein [Flavobacterium paronense]|nr:T9SS type A sorting domain-containing protein [Flavobacterium paronense]MDN3675877.1 T9SS type A sorting domain-containing protein [Flavobacterium paronense]
MIEDNLKVTLIDELGKVIQTNEILQGSTLCIMDLTTVYNGIYFVRIANAKDNKTFKIIVNK